MEFKIAAASTDGVNINEHFGSAAYFIIIDVNDDGSYKISERREVIVEGNETKDSCDGSTNAAACEGDSCGKQSGGGCSGGHGGGHLDSRIQTRIDVISDCRCLLCARCGPGAEKQLEKKAITTFQINVPLEEALEKIISYYTKIDNHISLRKSRLSQ